MTFLFDIFLIILMFSVFAAMHTILALKSVKEYIAFRVGKLMAFYRMVYILFSLFLFAVFFMVAPKPDINIYDFHYPYDIVIFIIQLLALMGLLSAAAEIDIREFMGLNQIRRWLNSEYKAKDLDEKPVLYTGGFHGCSRHPVYFFTILFLGLRPAMDLFYLTAFLCISAYFYIGSIFEERRMIQNFGEQYRQYQSKVPRIIPNSLFKCFSIRKLK